jgi:ATP-dependent Lhr-like helicase
VFVNSRKQVDAGTNYFRYGPFEQANVYGHHGNLSKEERERVEERFRSDRRAVCVATMTLEVGIDIGDVDLVVCLDPPFSLSSFLQRIGRGCRRLNGRTRVVCVARNRAGEIVFNALIHQSRRGIPPGPMIPLRRSVLVQQVLAYLRQAPKHRRTLRQLERVFTSETFPIVPEAVLLDVLNSMLSSGLLVSQNEIYAPAQGGWDFIGSSRIYSNISPSLETVTLVDADTGRSIATVRSLGGDSATVKIAGQDFSVLKGGHASRRLVRLEGEAATAPEYHARGLPYAFDVGASLANYLGAPADRLLVLQAGDRLTVMTWLGRLFNTAIAHCFERMGYVAKPKSFSLSIANMAPDMTLAAIAQSISSMKEHNPLGNARLERIVDLGPHSKWLSEHSLRQAREEWLDQEFLQSWISRMHEVVVLSPGDAPFADVSEVANL